MALTQEQSNAIYKNILSALQGGLETGEIEAYEASEIAAYILDEVEKIDDESKTNDFYTKLSEQWPFLEVLIKQNREDQLETMENEAAEGALSLLKHGKVEDALSVAKAATSN